MRPIFNPIQDLDPSDTNIKKNGNPINKIQVIIRTPSSHERAPRFIKKSVKNSGIQSHPRPLPKWYIYGRKKNPLKKIQVIIWTPMADWRSDGQTDGQTDGQGESSIPPLNFVAWGIISQQLIAFYQIDNMPLYIPAILLIEAHLCHKRITIRVGSHTAIKINSKMAVLTDS